MMWLLIALSGLLAGLLYLYYRIAYAPYNVLSRIGIKGPKPRAFWGNVLDISAKGGLLGMNKFMMETYGPVSGYYIGATPAIVLCDPELLKQVMVKQFDCFTDRKAVGGNNDLNRTGLPPSLLMAKGDVWRTSRHVVSPTFSTMKMKLMATQIDKGCLMLLEKLDSVANSDMSIDIWRTYSLFTMEVILAVAFDREVDLQRSKDDQLTQAAAHIFKFGRNNNPFLLVMQSHFPALASLVGRFRKSELLKCLEYLKDTASALVQARRQQGASAKQKSLLQLLIEASGDEQEDGEEKCHADRTGRHESALEKKGKLSDAEIVSNCIAFLLAGYETTANTLAFTSYLLAMNPDVQEKLHDEIEEYFTTKPEASVYDASQEIDYLDMVIQESLRIYPPGAMTNRLCTKSADIGGFIVPEGISIIVPIMVLHHDKKIWDEPEKFRPERFTEEEIAKRPQLSHMPFGWGPRNCVGMRLALLEAKSTLVHVLRKYKFVRGPDTEENLQTSLGITLAPKNGINLRIVSRM